MPVCTGNPQLPGRHFKALWILVMHLREAKLFFRVKEKCFFELLHLGKETSSGIYACQVDINEHDVML